MAWIDRGPPPKITPEIRDIILEGISKNLPYKMAAWLAKIHERTLFRWLEKGANEIEDGLITDYTELCQSIKALEAKKAAEHLDSVQDQSERWQARAWILERRWREFFTEKSTEIEFREELDKLKESVSGEKKDG